MEAPAPGARVLIRNEEWLVRNANLCDQGGWELECLGVSETVRHREALFLTQIDRVEVLDPANTDLVDDNSPAYIGSRLYLEAKLRQTVPTGPELSLGHRGAMDTLPFQLLPTHRVLQQVRPRFLIADSVGLGKTLEAGILLSELIRRGKGRRILVVTTKAMMRQFQQELWNRFTIPLTRLDSAGIQRIRRQLPANHNPFLYHDKTIISVDTLKKDREYRHWLEKAFWDVIVIDEAHNVSFKGGARSQRGKLANLLSTRSEALVLLTATPHNGEPESFASLMRMLDQTVLPPRKRDYTRDDIGNLFLRRFKADVRDEIRQHFPERQVFRFRAKPSAAEDRAFARLAELELAIDVEKRGADLLFRTTLEKALLSSPAACAQTLRERMNRLQKVNPQHSDLPSLQRLRDAVEAIPPDEVSKLNELVARLKVDPHWKWDKSVPNDRLVIFTERIETLKFLEAHLPRKLGLHEEAVAILHGQLPDLEIQQTVEDFGKTHSPLRVLIASDVASEGINLHFQSHRLVHFDIPWSLMVFQQRNGRVDRYGQAQTPLIAYLINDLSQVKLRGDVRILEILTEKDEQAARNIGDPSIFFGLYDEGEEVKRVATAIETGESPEAFDAQLQKPEDALDWLDALMVGGGGAAVEQAKTREPLSLFASDADYLQQALRFLHGKGLVARAPEAEGAALSVQPDEDLHSYLKQQLGDDLRPAQSRYTLSADREEVKRAISRARDENKLPDVQLLWQIHPMMQWVDYRVMSLLKRQTAPVIRVPRGVGEREVLVLVAAVIPNKRGQAMLNDWFAVRVGADNKVLGMLSLQEVVKTTGFGNGDIANASKPFDAAELKQRLKPALDLAAQHMRQKQKEFIASITPRINDELGRLDALRGEHMKQLDLAFSDSMAMHQRRKQEEQQQTERLFSNYKDWVRATFELDSRAQLTVAAALIA
ncbi:DEAD/DEAH box helicase [Burkholderia vietnamiensis]|uniref:DEAD/DEAH box helicase n=1 Tax=Burkholderia vietnamiensis TaxID=60552 RepID=UPI001CB455C2|nr:DEAD/DEAH box helicase [Burkholderia vietnamiensis]CAG9234998.1 Helicase SNF2 [Burkholderia vietnamiensis]